MFKVMMTMDATLMPAELKPRSPWLGRASLVVVGFAFLPALAAAIPAGVHLADSVYQAGYFTNPDIARLPEPVQVEVGRLLTIIEVACALGLAGWVAGLVAAATNRGRTWGVVAIIIGLLAPFLVAGVLGAGIIMNLPSATQ